MAPPVRAWETEKMRMILQQPAERLIPRTRSALLAFPTKAAASYKPPVGRQDAAATEASSGGGPGPAPTKPRLLGVPNAGLLRRVAQLEKEEEKARAAKQAAANNSVKPVSRFVLETKSISPIPLFSPKAKAYRDAALSITRRMFGGASKEVKEAATPTQAAITSSVPPVSSCVLPTVEMESSSPILPEYSPNTRAYRQVAMKLNRQMFGGTRKEFKEPSVPQQFTATSSINPANGFVLPTDAEMESSSPIIREYSPRTRAYREVAMKLNRQIFGDTRKKVKEAAAAQQPKVLKVADVSSEVPLQKSKKRSRKSSVSSGFKIPPKRRKIEVEAKTRKRKPPTEPQCEVSAKRPRLNDTPVLSEPSVPEVGVEKERLGTPTRAAVKRSQSRATEAPSEDSAKRRKLGLKRGSPSISIDCEVSAKKQKLSLKRSRSANCEVSPKRSRLESSDNDEDIMQEENSSSEEAMGEESSMLPENSVHDSDFDFSLGSAQQRARSALKRSLEPEEGPAAAKSPSLLARLSPFMLFPLTKATSGPHQDNCEEELARKTRAASILRAAQSGISSAQAPTPTGVRASLKRLLGPLLSNEPAPVSDGQPWDVVCPEVRRESSLHLWSPAVTIRPADPFEHITDDESSFGLDDEPEYPPSEPELPQPEPEAPPEPPRRRSPRGVADAVAKRVRFAMKARWVCWERFDPNDPE